MPGLTRLSCLPRLRELSHEHTTSRAEGDTRRQPGAVERAWRWQRRYGCQRAEYRRQKQTAVERVWPGAPVYVARAVLPDRLHLCSLSALDLAELFRHYTAGRDGA